MKNHSWKILLDIYPKKKSERSVLSDDILLILKAELEIIYHLKYVFQLASLIIPIFLFRRIISFQLIFHISSYSYRSFSSLSFLSLSNSPLSRWLISLERGSTSAKIWSVDIPEGIYDRIWIELDRYRILIEYRYQISEKIQFLEISFRSYISIMIL